MGLANQVFLQDVALDILWHRPTIPLILAHTWRPEVKAIVPKLSRLRRLDLRPSRVWRRIRSAVILSPNWRFFHDVGQLIWEYRWYSLAILAVTVSQEFAALWPVNLLGQFVDGLSTGELGGVVWLLMCASLLYPGIVRGNTILRHKMFYETEFRTRVEMVIQEAERGGAEDVEEASAAHTRVLNAVSGVTNAAYHLLGSFVPVIIKVVVVAGNLLGYNRILGLAYLGSLAVPSLMTVLFNRKLQVLRDAQYSVISRSSGVGVKVISQRGDPSMRERFVEIMRERTGVLISLLARHQSFLYIREAALVGSQFLVVFLALALRERVGLTPGDFTRIVGYTTQVAAAFITTASTLDAIISYSRAYHAFDQAHTARAASPP